MGQHIFWDADPELKLQGIGKNAAPVVCQSFAAGEPPYNLVQQKTESPRVVAMSRTWGPGGSLGFERVDNGLAVFDGGRRIQCTEASLVLEKHLHRDVRFS